jgi:Zn finger protein HypA/HybF involved in hydrogenase expression
MSLHSSMSPKSIIKRILRDQSSGAPIDTEAKARNAEKLEMALELMKAEKLAASLPDFVGIFNAVADMTAEEEAALNAQIEVMEFSCPHCGFKNPCKSDDVWFYCLPCDAFIDRSEGAK